MQKKIKTYSKASQDLLRIREMLDIILLMKLSILGSIQM